MLFNRARLTRFDGLLGRKNTSLRSRMTPSDPSFWLSRRRTFSRPADTPFDVEPPIQVGFSWYSVIRSRSLHTCTSAALSTSHDIECGPFVARIFGCHASRVDGSPAGGVVGGGVFSPWRLVFDPLGRIWRSEYFGRGRSSGYFRKQLSM